MLRRYGLKDWKFEFDKTRLCNGQADLLNKTISMSIFFANRANALLEVKRFEECIRDCNKAIELYPTFIKSYYRKAKALY